MHCHAHPPPANQRSFRLLLLWFGCLALAGLGVFLMIAFRRRSDVVEALPYVLFLFCPALHLLLHGGHGHPGAEQPVGTSDEKREHT